MAELTESITPSEEQIDAIRKYTLGLIRNSMLHILMVYMTEKKFTLKEAAAELDVKEDTITSILYGLYDGTISEMVRICLKIGKVPLMFFRPLEEVMKVHANNESYELTTVLRDAASQPTLCDFKADGNVQTVC